MSFGLTLVICVVYLDNILIYSKSLNEHVEHLRTIIVTLREEHLYANLKKCVLCTDQVTFLGFIGSSQRLAVDPEKIKSIQVWPKPINISQVQSFHGLASFYRRYVLLNTLDSKLLGFSFIKEHYATDLHFREKYKLCETDAHNKYYQHDGYLFKEERLCISQGSMREILTKEAHEGGLMRHFGVEKTLSILKEHFFWPKIKRKFVSSQLSHHRGSLKRLWLPYVNTAGGHIRFGALVEEGNLVGTKP
ncbi:uncharacterized protein LOC120173986 [Hibiscus syriacus]|uniref:uncharacterized protein LOC120173986 n=1 Tax=Hibiscus syriacus TaxID=106335 RepID=UPI001924DBE2|nr:uncharacterized protein LOC120173986 [Hibiscus syriacus]